MPQRPQCGLRGQRQLPGVPVSRWWSRPACGRLCEARILKFYATPGTVPGPELSDLFLDPDEKGLHQGDPTSLVTALSNPTGGYATLMRRMNCCIDAWWPQIVTETGTLCTTGLSCPADLTCNQ